MTTFVFPGQGSQCRGMGGQLFEEFSELTAKADALLGYSSANLCLLDPNNLLNQTQYTQPMLYLVSALSYYKRSKNSNETPSYLAGHSLGEYNALLAAGVFDFETGLKLVRKRGELMSQAQNGGMAAVIGLNRAQIETTLQKNNLEKLAVANHNTYTQIVLSGAKSDIDRAQPLLEAAGAQLYIPLKVSGAFHSPFMQEAQIQFADYLGQFQFNPPNIPVIANVTAEPYQQVQTSQLLAQQITSSVKWTETIEYLFAKGESIFEEIGVGTVLTGLIRKIRNKQ